MTEHDLSFLENYSKIRGRLFDHGRTVEIEPKGPKVVVRRHESDRLIKKLQNEAAERERTKVRSFLAKPRWRRILDEVAEKHGLKVKDLIGQSRLRRMVLPRHEAMFRMWSELGMSTPDIGRRMDRDHTTAIHAICAHARRNGLPVTRGGGV